MTEQPLEVTLGPEELSLLRKDPELHKYGHGHAVIFSGGHGHTGAARLAARAALRIGAGLATLAVPDQAISEVAAQVTEIMIRRVDDAAGAVTLLSDPRINAVCIGPGFGPGVACREMVGAVLGSAAGGFVLDADALTSFQGMTEALVSALPEGRCVLTPHSGEFARLFPDLDLADPVSAALACARNTRAVVVLKGAQTVVAGPQGRVSQHNLGRDRDAPWLATAGSGDVLAGMITGLLARRVTPQKAAEIAVWLHVEAARRFGAGLLAGDLPDMLPEVLRNIGV
ncbi:NAD(P)H-hydrate dehydratase [Pseudooceanicola sp. C21-150M6]|uniref:NAD(P)H-hydrate dehydratase n=1 Tax=Pseudooceanicola sp. C21-150M6 TaxID=3434355 RepID=UPI003D7F93C0